MSQVKISDFRPVRKFPMPLFIVLACQLAILPLVTTAISHLHSDCPSQTGKPSASKRDSGMQAQACSSHMLQSPWRNATRRGMLGRLDARFLFPGLRALEQAKPINFIYIY